MDELTRKLIIAEAKIKNCKRVGSSNKASQDMEEGDPNIVEGLGIGNPKVISVLDVYLTGPHSDSWIFDTGSVAHICNTTSGLKDVRRLNPGEVCLFYCTVFYPCHQLPI